MKPYHYLPIPGSLKETVSWIGVMHVDFSKSSLSATYHLPWTNNIHLVFPLCDEPLSIGSSTDQLHKGAYIVGPRLVSENIVFRTKSHVLGITFKPGAIHRLTRIAIEDLINRELDALLVLGAGIRDAEARLRAAKTHAEILEIVEQFLLKKLKFRVAASPFDVAVDELLARKGNISIDDFAHYACTSIRQLERRSLERLGMSPKLFARLTRFAKAYALKEMSPNLSWTCIAHQLGYCDQTHLIRDFKAFSGRTPCELNLSDASSTKIMAVLEGLY